jgi:FkbM family methyltransferase
VPRPRSTDALATLLAGVELDLVDIGARGRPRPELELLAPFSRLFAFEPDAAEAARLAGELEGGEWRSVTVVPAAITAQEGTATLHETAAPGMSSLLEPDPAVYARYANPEAFEVVGRSTVSTLPLDLAAERHGFEHACFVKIDTQGTELEILESGPRLLRGLLGVYVEALFQPFYVGQSLFADTDGFLRAHGFLLAELRPRALRAGGFREELLSERQTTWAHCLYLRDPAAPLDREARVREIAVALAYGHNDLALALAEHEDELARLVDEHVREETRRRLEEASPKERKRLLRASARE